MGEYVLHKSFFKNNPLDKMSAAVLADYHIRTQEIGELHDKMNSVLQSFIDEDRKAAIEQERAEIEAPDSGEGVVSHMRKLKEISLDYDLYNKAMTLEAETAPMILKRYMTSGQDHFIELSIRMLASFDRKYTDQLFSAYKEIRNPYAKAAACLLFGEKKMEDAVPLLMREYKRFKQEFPEENLSQFPLLALYILYEEA